MTHWHPTKYYSHQQLSATMRNWLLHRGSMTKKLKTAGSAFHLTLTHQAWQAPLVEEYGPLKLNHKQYSWVREVIISLDNQPCILGRCVIPVATLSGYEKQLLKLGTKPLGYFLFSHPNMRRDAFELARLSSAAAPRYFTGPASVLCQQTNWMRRSVFYLSGKPLLLTELFFEEVCNT